MAQTTKSKRKAPNGAGSVRYDRSRKRWLATVTTGWDSSGRQRRRKSYHQSEREALDWLHAERSELDAQLARGIDAGKLPTFRTTTDFLAWWLEHALPGNVSATTEQNYRDVVRLYIVPHVGKVPLKELQPAHVSAMLRSLSDAGKAPRTQQLARAVLSKAIKRAESEGLVMRNVARLADAPRQANKEGRTLTQIQARRLLTVLHHERYGAAFIMALMLGLRRGEVLALSWSDIDAERNTVSIRRSLKKVGGAWVPSATKTRTSRRTLFLPAPVIDALVKWSAVQDEERRLAGPEWSTDPLHADLVFTSAFGRPVDGSSFRRWLGAATEKAGLGRWTPHELRHSAASLMLAEGVPLKVVSEALGHSSVRVTGDVYAHVLDPARQGLADVMSRALGLDPDVKSAER